MTNIMKIRNLMKRIRISEGMDPEDFWFRSSENISEETNLYWLEYMYGGMFVIETAVGWVSIEHVNNSLVLNKIDKEFFIPEDGMNGVLWVEDVFSGRFIDVCRYILAWKERRENHIYGYFNI